ncbi:hypothetical protein E0H75_05550 [Kribbella capetownensis]|uniref:Phage tail lysozyme domain-containing protein n=1 Tax=Kribbella capetownensis TaxID=1572659 RepID=A0A4V2M8X9_9ACTN|nr:phage tail tip lysozyme [Kribbella capetownensis]TCC53182.1 hypothetical protein E0H75_05550 [Kribbella capetownensis]
MGDIKVVPVIGGVVAALFLPLLIVLALVVVGLAGMDTAEAQCDPTGLTGKGNRQQAFNFFVSAGYSKEQAAGVVGNLITESSVEPALRQGDVPGTVTHPADMVDSPLGWGLVQWTPAGKLIEPARQAGVADATIESLEFQLDFLKDQLDGGGPVPEKVAGDKLKVATTVDEATFAFGYHFERFADRDDLAGANWAQRKADARTVLERYGDGASGGQCDGGIVETALALAWDTPGHGHDPKPAYAAAEAAYNGSKGYDELTDCGVFVATVMVMSGADKDYVRRLTSSQRAYVRGSPKYEVFEDLTNEGQLRPGDIFVHDGHTFIYTGNYTGGDGKTYNAASASLTEHVPEASRVYFSDSRGHYTVARRSDD